MTHSPANPFYAARRRARPAETPTPGQGHAYARLPRAPRTASPVPHLTRRCTFPDHSKPVQLLLLAVAAQVPFTADEFLAGA